MSPTSNAVERARSELEDPWPPFLDLLQHDVDRAAEDFYRFAMRILRACPPSRTRSLDKAAREELFHESIVTCVLNDCAKLRQYENKGKPFANWFFLVARNRISDLLDARMSHDKVDLDEVGEGSIDERLGPHIPRQRNPERTTELAQAASKALELMSRIPRDCQIILRLTARDFSISEILRVLRLPQSKNVELSNRRAYCRNLFKQSLLAEGLLRQDLY